MKKILKSLRDMKVKKRLVVSFLSVVMMASIAGILGSVLLIALDSRYGTALELNGFIQGDIGHYNSYLNKSGAFVRDIIILTDEKEIAEAKANMENSDALAEYYFNEFVHKLETAEERALTDLIEAKYPEYIEARDAAIEFGLQNDNDLALDLFRKEAIPILQEVMGAADQLLAMNVEMGDNVSDELTLLSWILVVIIVVVIFLAVLASMFFANYTAKDFSGQIEEVRAATYKLAAGELNIEVQAECKNELGDMAEHFNMAVAQIRTYIEAIEFGLSEVAKGNFAVCPPIEFQGDFVALKTIIENITASLSDTMKQINLCAQQVSLGSEQLAQGAQSLAEGATSQAGAVEELTATVENVADASEESAKKADRAYQNAEAFAKVAEESSQAMELLTRAMGRITETSREIESIIAEIEDIASQTNLLSLNASIEAARAGEAGRGFAVVADQIGKLATDSAKSAVNTRSLIAKSLEEVNQGDAITEKTAAALEEVISGIRLLEAASKEASELSREQVETVVQVKQGIGQIAEVVQSNSAAAEETSATSEELAAQAQNLKALVEQFTLLD